MTPWARLPGLRRQNTLSYPCKICFCFGGVGMLILKPCFPVFSKKAGGRRWAETNQCEHWDVHSVGFFWHFASQQTFLLTSERFSHPKSRSQTWIPALPAPPNPKSKPWQGIPALCWAWIVLSMGLGWARGERLWENLRVSYFPRRLSQLSVATLPTMGLKKLRATVVVARF